MNDRQREALIVALEEFEHDRWWQGEYKHGDRFCIAGWLSYKAGDYYPWLGDASEEKFGLHPSQNGDIVDINDMACDFNDMMKKVKEYLRV